MCKFQLNFYALTLQKADFLGREDLSKKKIETWFQIL